MFGASRPAFGQAGNSPFGQTSQSNAFGQQPNTTNNSMFGSNSANNASSGFGGFGTTNNAQTMNSPFGMSQQQQNSTQLPFGGAPANPMSNPPSLFGGSQSSGTVTSPVSSGPGSGTGIKPFQPYTEKDLATGLPTVFQSITCMPEYKNYSFEELRFQDYQQNRKFNTTAGGATNAIASPFGQQTNGTNNTFALGNKSAMPTGQNTFGQNTTTPFGQQQQNTAFGQNTSGFGQPQQQSGMFGQTSNSPFGQPNSSTTSPFGMNKPSTSGGLFGQGNNPTGTFGQTSTSTFGQNQQNQQGAAFGQNAGTTFGTGLGQQGSNTTGGLFGQGTSTSGGLFGQQSNNTFGQGSSTGGLFGSKPAESGAGLFGQNQQQQQQQSGLFGQTPSSQFGQGAATNTSPFGQTNASQGGTLFGQGQNASNTSGGLFGQSNTMNQQGGGLFGSKPTTTSTGLFGQTSQTQQQPQSGGLFGQNAPQQASSIFAQGAQQQQPQTGGLFGQNAQQPSGGLFGQSNSQQPTSGAIGQNLQQQQGLPPFGQNTQQQPSGSIFGSKPVGTSGGLFGQNTQQSGSGGLFGQAPQQQPQQQGGLFGQNNQQQPTSGGLFGSKPAGSTLGGTGGLFGNSAQSTSTSGGLFGSKPTAGTGTTTGGLFGSKPPGQTTATTTTGLFGAKPAAPSFGTSSTTSAPAGGSSLFGGAKPATSGSTGLFGQQSGNATASGTGLFGGAPLTQAQTIQGQQQQQQQQPQSIMQGASNPYGTNDLFSRVISIPDSITQPAKPSATKVNADLKKKNSLSTAYKLAPKPLFDSKNKGNLTLRVKISLKSQDEQEKYAKPSLALIEQSEKKPLFSENTDLAIMNTENLLFNPDRKSFKNLIVNRNKMEQTLDEPNENKFITFRSDEDSPNKIEVKEDTGIFARLQETPVGKFNPISAEITEKTKNEELGNKESTQSKLIGDDISFVSGGYYISPSFETLNSFSLMELRKVEHLIIGHKDFGKIEFLQPVDLSIIALPSLCGKLVVFENRCCTITYIGEKPDKGQGLNVRAKITLVGCYPLDKANGNPIKDPEHPVLRKHVENLKSMTDEKFQSYNVENGSWSFITEEPVV